MAKDRIRTEQKLLDAVGGIMIEEGFPSLGVNSVAQRAGVSKMLIYRYFGDFDGLLREWALRNNFWSETGEQAIHEIERIGRAGGKGQDEYGELLKQLFTRQCKAVRTSAMRREVLRWMLVEDSEAGRQAMETVEDLGLAITRAFRERISSPVDIEAGAAVLIGGIYYLALVSDRVPVFNGVDLGSQEGWKRISGVIGLIVDSLFEDTGR